jgi:hypothetical protein
MTRREICLRCVDSTMERTSEGRLKDGGMWERLHVNARARVAAGKCPLSYNSVTDDCNTVADIVGGADLHERHLPDFKGFGCKFKLELLAAGDA